MSGAFNRYIGIDYSGAETCDSSLKGLRVYAADPLNEPLEVAPPPSLRKYWTRKTIADSLRFAYQPESRSALRQSAFGPAFLGFGPAHRVTGIESSS
jgi:hypothetical protein